MDHFIQKTLSSNTIEEKQEYSCIICNDEDDETVFIERHVNEGWKLIYNKDKVVMFSRTIH